MKTVSRLCLLAVIGVLLTGSGLYAQGSGQPATKENLDLPYDAFGLSEEEEEAPEVVFFYGQQYEGDGFFFCLDRSSSVANGELDIEKREAIRTISQFSKHVQFAIVFYDQGMMKWPGSGRPAEANGSMKSGAISFLSTIQSGSGTCVKEGVLEAINFANRSSAKRNVIIYLGDGGTSCPGAGSGYKNQTISQVAAANFKKHQINVICVGVDGGMDESFCKALANSNGGTYRKLSR